MGAILDNLLEDRRLDVGQRYLDGTLALVVVVVILLVPQRGHDEIGKLSNLDRDGEPVLLSADLCTEGKEVLARLDRGLLSAPLSPIRPTALLVSVVAWRGEGDSLLTRMTFPALSSPTPSMVWRVESWWSLGMCRSSLFCPLTEDIDAEVFQSSNTSVRSSAVTFELAGCLASVVWGPLALQAGEGPWPIVSNFGGTRHHSGTPGKNRDSQKSKRQRRSRAGRLGGARNATTTAIPEPGSQTRRVHLQYGRGRE